MKMRVFQLCELINIENKDKSASQKIVLYHHAFVNINFRQQQRPINHPNPTIFKMTRKRWSITMDKQLNLIGDWVDCIDKATSRRTSYTSHILDQLLWDSKCTLGLLLGCYWVALGLLLGCSWVSNATCFQLSTNRVESIGIP